jgi:hypothetical protein
MFLRPSAPTYLKMRPEAAAEGLQQEAKADNVTGAGHLGLEVPEEEVTDLAVEEGAAEQQLGQRVVQVLLVLQGLNQPHPFPELEKLRNVRTV